MPLSWTKISPKDDHTPSLIEGEEKESVHGHKRSRLAKKIFFFSFSLFLCLGAPRLPHLRRPRRGDLLPERRAEGPVGLVDVHAVQPGRRAVAAQAADQGLLAVAHAGADGEPLTRGKEL